MNNRRLTTGLVALTLAVMVACQPDSAGSPVTPIDVRPNPASVPATTRAFAARGKLNGLERRAPLKADRDTSVVIGPAGGVLELPAVGLRLVVPAGAVSRPTPFRVTALAGRLVAYDFEPAGSTFPVALRIEQDLSFLDGRHVGTSRVMAGYFPTRADLDQEHVTGTVTEVISAASTPTAVTFPVWHFSGYVVGWGFTGDESAAY